MSEVESGLAAVLEEEEPPSADEFGLSKDEFGEEPDTLPRPSTSNDVNEAFSQTVAQLHSAAKSGQTAVVTSLLRDGLDPDSINMFGNTALHTAAALGNSSVCRVLIEAGSKVNAQMETNGRTPLHVATAGGHLGTIVGLIKRNADINILDMEKKCPLDLVGDHVRDKTLSAYCEASPYALMAAYPMLQFKHRKHEWKNFHPLLQSKDKYMSCCAAKTFGQLPPQFRELYQKEFIAAMRTHPIEFLTAFSEAAFFKQDADFASSTEEGLANARVFETESRVRKTASDPQFAHRVTEQADVLARVIASSRTEMLGTAEAPMNLQSSEAPEAEQEDPYAVEPPHSAPPLTPGFVDISGGAGATAPPAKLPAVPVPTSLEDAVARFVPMESRDVMSWFAKTSTDNAKIVAGLLKAFKLDGSMDEPHTAARAFVQVQIELAEKHRAYLLAVVRVQRLRLANLWTGTWQGISREPNFKEYTDLAQLATSQAENVHGKKPSQLETRYEELAKQARLVHMRHKRFLRSLAALTGTTPIELPLKSDVRSMIESGTQPGDQQWACGMICDFVRGGVVCPKVVQMKLLLDLMLACSALTTSCPKDAEALGKNREAIVITAVQDRVLSPVADGKWPTTTINYYFADDVHRHVCEVELVHSEIDRVRSEHGAEKLYCQVRTSVELMGALGISILPAGYAVPTIREEQPKELDMRLRSPGDRLVVRMNLTESRLAEQHSMLVASRDFTNARIQDIDAQVTNRMATCSKTLGDASDALQQRAVNVTELMTTAQNELETRVEDRHKQLVTSNSIRQAALVKQLQSANAQLNEDVTTNMEGTVDSLEDAMRQMTAANHLTNEAIAAKQAHLDASTTEKLQTSLDIMEVKMAKVTTDGQEIQDAMQKSHLELEVRVANAVGKLVKMQQTQITEQRSLIAAQQSELDSHQQQIARQQAEINKLQLECSRIDGQEATSTRHQAQLKRLEPLLWFAPHLEALLSGSSSEVAEKFATSAATGMGAELKNTDADQLMEGGERMCPGSITMSHTVTNSPPRPINTPTNSTTLPLPPQPESQTSAQASSNTLDVVLERPLPSTPVTMSPGRAGWTFAERLANVCQETPEPALSKPSSGGEMLLSAMGKSLTSLSDNGLEDEDEDDAEGNSTPVVNRKLGYGDNNVHSDVNNNAYSVV